MSNTVTLQADELKVSHNIYREGYIYTVAEITPSGDDVIVRVISPRVVEDHGFKPVTSYTWHKRRPITVYQ